MESMKADRYHVKAVELAGSTDGVLDVHIGRTLPHKRYPCDRWPGQLFPSLIWISFATVTLCNTAEISLCS